jgi:galactokinase
LDEDTTVSDGISLGELTRAEALKPRLVAAGLGRSAAAEKAKQFGRSARTLFERGLTAETRVRAFFVPGRIEVLGKHTDYCGGRSMLAVVERGFSLVIGPRTDPLVRMTDVGLGETIEFAVDPELQPKLGQWCNYPMTAARRIARDFADSLVGGEIAFVSDLPVAAGMSSSSALIVATFLALSAVNRLDQRGPYRQNISNREDLASYLGTVENGQNFGSLAGDKGVGTFGGSEDHTAMLCSQPRAIRQYAYCPIRFERALALPDDWMFGIASSGITAEKTGAAREKYNLASRLASGAAELWRKETGRDDIHLAAAIESSEDAASRMLNILKQSQHPEFSPQQLVDRFQHFYNENYQIIPAAGDALAEGNSQRFGALVDQSQAFTDTLLHNQVPETMFLANSARAVGAVAASAFGAGFGGSVWALFRSADAASMLDEWSQRYAKQYPHHADKSVFFFSEAGPAAFEIR